MRHEPHLDREAHQLSAGFAGDDVVPVTVRLNDLTSEATYDRAGGEMVSKGLYLDLPTWGYHVFEMKSV